MRADHPQTISRDTAPAEWDAADSFSLANDRQQLRRQSLPFLQPSTSVERLTIELVSQGRQSNLANIY